MPDITMCAGDGCPVKENCYRYTAKASGRQSYFAMTPYDKGCVWFWDNEGGRNYNVVARKTEQKGENHD